MWSHNSYGRQRCNALAKEHLKSFDHEVLGLIDIAVVIGPLSENEKRAEAIQMLDGKPGRSLHSHTFTVLKSYKILTGEGPYIAFFHHL